MKFTETGHAQHYKQEFWEMKLMQVTIFLQNIERSGSLINLKNWEHHMKYLQIPNFHINLFIMFCAMDQETVFPFFDFECGEPWHAIDRPDIFLCCVILENLYFI